MVIITVFEDCYPRKWFKLKAIKRATSSFSNSNRLGTGQYGLVYFGELRDGTPVAVKKFKRSSPDPTESIFAELRVQQAISADTHPHVRELLAISNDAQEPYIVYEYLPQGNLTQHLRGKRGDYLINDAFARLNVAIDVAGALCELHYNCEFPIYHRDVKSANVLLDDDYGAKLADMGIAVVVETNEDVNTPEALGAVGYLCPVYEQTRRLHDKSDVYSFGVLLMELATCMTVWDERGRVRFLVDMVADKLRRGHADELIQPGNVRGGRRLTKAMLRLAQRCCSLNLASRPRIDKVADELEDMDNYYRR